MYEFEVTETLPNGGGCCPKDKLVLEITKDGFNLRDEKGFCLINAGDIALSGQFGVNIDIQSFVKLTVSKSTCIGDSYSRPSRQDYIIRRVY